MANYKGYLKDKNQNKLNVSPDEVVISSEQPIGNDWKLWISDGEIQNIGSEVVNTLDGNETDKAPSVKIVKEELNKKPNTLNQQWIDSETDTYSAAALNKFFSRQLADKLTDINSIEACTTGFYTGYDVTNAPNVGWVTWITLAHNNDPRYCTQICAQLGSPQLYIRYRRENTFGSWNPIFK